MSISPRIGVTNPVAAAASITASPRVVASCTVQINVTGMLPSASWINYCKQGDNVMEKKLQDFLDTAFAPYGDFPARDDIKRELLSNLTEKYQDQLGEGKSEAEAYDATVES